MVIVDTINFKTTTSSSDYKIIPSLTFTSRVIIVKKSGRAVRFKPGSPVEDSFLPSLALKITHKSEQLRLLTLDIILDKCQIALAASSSGHWNPSRNR